MQKIIEITDIPRIRTYMSGKTIVLCHGTFDVLHPGHLKHVQEAKRLSGVDDPVLVVGLTADKHVHKGPGRPAWTEDFRAEMLAAWEIVDYVIIVDDPTALPLIEALRPDLYCKGLEYVHRKTDGNLARECALVESYGGRVEFAGQTLGRATQLVMDYFCRLSPEVQGFLREFNARHSLAEIKEWLEKALRLKVQVIGDAIIDRYVYCEPAGQAMKRPIIAWQHRSEASWYGGATVVARNASAVCDSVEAVISTPPLFKTRFFAQDRRFPVFYIINPIVTEPINLWNTSQMAHFDCVIMADFGHGALSAEDWERMGRATNFLAGMVQTNSLNYGHNLLTKMRRANYIVANRGESALVPGFAIPADIVATTKGPEGSSIYSAAEARFWKIPAISGDVIDRIGAGDAYLGCSAPLACTGAPPEIVGFIGSVAAGIKVGKIGNEPVTRTELRRTVEHLLK